MTLNHILCSSDSDIFLCVKVYLPAAVKSSNVKPFIAIVLGILLAGT